MTNQTPEPTTAAAPNDRKWTDKQIWAFLTFSDACSQYGEMAAEIKNESILYGYEMEIAFPPPAEPEGMDEFFEIIFSVLGNMAQAATYDEHDAILAAAAQKITNADAERILAANLQDAIDQATQEAAAIAGYRIDDYPDLPF